MPFALNGGVRIHYAVEGNGPPLVIQHGFTDSMQTWYENGSVEALKPSRTVILVDARGHGRSDKPHDHRAYSQAALAGDICAVLDSLGIEQSDYWGYSMGGRIGFAMARHAPGRLGKLVIGAAAGDGRSRIGSRARKLLREQGVAAIPALWGCALPDALRGRLLENDAAALEACSTDGLGFFDVLGGMTMPVLLYAGTADPIFPLVEETAAEIPGALLHAFPEFGHSDLLLRFDLAWPVVRAFLGDPTGYRGATIRT